MLTKLKKNQSHYFIKAKPKPKTKLGELWAKIIVKKYWLVGCSLFLIMAIVMGNWQPKKDNAMANESAMVTIALKQNSEQKLELNNPFSLTLTMQNSSSTESLNNLKLNLTNTVGAVKWVSAQNQNLPNGSLKFEENNLTIPNLSVNERVEYELIGNLQNNQIPVLAIVGSLNYNNSQGKQAAQTNRVLNYLKSTENPETKLELKSSKDSYEIDENVVLAVSRTISNSTNSNTNSKNNLEKLSGKIFVVNQKTQEQVAALDCQIELECRTETKFKNGNYSALFIEKNNYSTIKEFVVGKISNDLVISSQATLTLPFGKNSQNGQVAIVANKVLSGNQELKKDLEKSLECVFVISQDDKEISQIKTSILQDKSCRAIIDNLENGSYSVTLSGSSLKENFDFMKTEKNLELKNRNSSFEKNKNIELFAENLKEKLDEKTNEKTAQNQTENQTNSFQAQAENSKSSENSSSSENQTNSQNIDLNLDSNNKNTNIEFQSSQSQNLDNNPNIDISNKSEISNEKSQDKSEAQSISSEPKNLDNLKTSLFIFHTNSGDFKELKSLDGEVIVIKNGELKLNIPSSNFAESGNYKIWTKTENGEKSLNSQIVNVDFGDKLVGVVTSGIIFDYSSLVAGQEMVFKIQNLTDSSGNTAVDGKCSANLFLSGQKNPVEKNGEIKNTTCEVKFEKGEVKTAGKSLVAFMVGDQVKQARQIEIIPNNTITLGELQAEYEPIRKDFANTILIGPATDSFGNLANLENMTLEITKSLMIEENPNIEIDLKKINSQANLQSKSSVKNSQNEKQSEKKSDPRNQRASSNIRQINNISIQNGFAKVEVPASFLDVDNLKFRLIDENKREFLSQNFDLVANNGKLILPTFPSILKTEENLKATVAGIILKDTQIKDYKCELILANNNSENVKTEIDFDKNAKKCNFDWRLETARNQPKALLKMKIGEEKFSKIIDLEATNASNLFTTNIQTQLNEKSELILNLLTSPIFDKYGLTLNEKKVSWQYNGKKAETLTQNGLAKLEITADKLTQKDYKINQNKKNLDLDIDIKAGTTSISKTNNLNIFLQDFEIAKESQKVTIEKMSNVLTANTSQILQFASKTCSVLMIKNGKMEKLQTFWQAGSCFVQVKPIGGSYNLIFEKDGFESGQFSFTTGPKADITICDNQKQEKIENIKTANSAKQDCLVQVKGTNGEISVKIVDETKEYKFVSKDLENAVLVRQNGLNSNKKYLIQISFENENKQKVLWQEQVLGELLN